MPKLIGVNGRGNRIGEDHPCARLTDHEVALLLEMREQGWGYKRLAVAFEISKSQARRIVKGEQRAQHAVRYRLIR